jgi:hypothetical protein
MWGMGKCSINREQCNTPEELSVQAQAALAAITMNSINGMIENYSTLLCAILALRGQCLNVHPDVVRDLRHGVRIPEEIAHARETQTESLQKFVEGSRELFAILSSGDRPQGYCKWNAQSLSLIRKLQPEMENISKDSRSLERNSVNPLSSS